MNQDNEEISDKDVLIVFCVIVALGILAFVAAGAVVWGVMEIFGMI